VVMRKGAPEWVGVVVRGTRERRPHNEYKKPGKRKQSGPLRRIEQVSPTETVSRTEEKKP